MKYVNCWIILITILQLIINLILINNSRILQNSKSQILLNELMHNYEHEILIKKSVHGFLSARDNGIFNQ